MQHTTLAQFAHQAQLHAFYPNPQRTLHEHLSSGDSKG